MLRCVLEQRPYDLLESYENDLQVRLANADSEADLIAFIKGWGPLYISNEEQISGVASVSLGYHRAFQKWIKAFVDLVSAYKRADGKRRPNREAADKLRHAMQTFIQAEYARGRAQPIPIQEPVEVLGLKLTFGITGSIADWLEDAPLALVQSATASLVGTHWFVAIPTLNLGRSEGRPTSDAGWDLINLEGAITWMVWKDEFDKHPVVSCHNCGRVFRGETAHSRKFCTRECAQREMSRLWQRKRRKAERRARKPQRRK